MTYIKQNSETGYFTGNLIQNMLFRLPHYQETSSPMKNFIIIALIVLAVYFAMILTAPDKHSKPEVPATVATDSLEANHKEPQPLKPMQQDLPQVNQQNVFFSDYETPYGIPPFEQIKDDYFLPAVKRGIEIQLAEIARITANKEAPDFANTIEALEWSGSDLTRVTNVFFNLTSANTNDTRRKLQAEIAPLLSSHFDDIRLNKALFERVKAVYQHKEEMTLRVDQRKLLEDTYKSFIRGGANLSVENKQILRNLNKRISQLNIQFDDNLRAETNDYELVIDKKEDLAGLPEDIILAAATTAKERGHEGKWVFTTHRISKTPFLTYSTNRQLKRKLFYAYTHRGDNGNAHDNNKIAAEIVALRNKKAHLLGYKSHADYVLEERNAKSPENVFKLMDKVWKPAMTRARKEVADIQAMADAEGGHFSVEASDWRYYAEKIRKARYDFDEAEARPYFSLEATLKGVFYTANRLFGLTFKERHDLPKYHEDVRTFEVYDNNRLIGIYLTDHFVRPAKRGGAWMNSYRKQSRKNGKNVLPIVVNVLNFPKPVGDEPALLTFDQARTLFHEFGHALHGLLSDGVYPSQTGTSVPRDYVEFPSQVMEYWFSQPEVLKHFARHYQTDQVIPDSLLKKINKASKFNQGFKTGEYMAAAYLDMAWYAQPEEKLLDTHLFEKQAMDKIDLIPQIYPRYRTTYFRHIFAGGYSAGYYSYLWTDVLAADAFEAFKEKGIFDAETAAKFKKYIFSSGGTDDSMTLYRKFRGKEPSIEPLLRSRGLVETQSP